MNPNASTSPQDPLSIETVVVPQASDLGGGFKVMRALPSVRRRMVGPFVFLDQMGPVELAGGSGLDVRPHPHIGLATVTYLFDGEILHRDSLGNVQPIRPGELNWMTAGRGIVHSERTPPELRPSGSRLAGLQAWVALPARDEDSEPAFAHHGAAELPVIDAPGLSVRLIAGEAFGTRSPVATHSPLFYADVTLAPPARLQVPIEHVERAAYIVAGSVVIDGVTHSAGQLLVLRRGAKVVITALSATRLMLLGGEPPDGPRHVWWNFVSSSRERIEQAKADWRAGRFAPVPGETEFIPLPDNRPPLVRYP
ncbi:pirin family protein [Aromatoleum buckelii]|uniref:Pirin n=1 Tax=Aromatoleum buckelii TaxID=200254 RepID=A0ABX1N7P6_9RHOO|nr:pirin family protein [Aromatoleum buckelii]MCK0511558.1 pirin family protein [Aromatoleum buckelii]